MTDVARWAVERELHASGLLRSSRGVVGRHGLVEPDDLRQAALTAVLEKCARIARSEAYARAVARRVLQRYASRQAAVPAVPVGSDAGRRFAERVTVDVADGFVAFAGDPEAELLAAEAAAARRRAIRRARRALARILAGLRAWEVRAIRRLWGLGGSPPERPRAIAASLRRPVRDIYRLRKNARRRLLASAAARDAHLEASEARQEDRT